METSIFTRWKKTARDEVESYPYAITVSMLSDKGCVRPGNEDRASYSYPQPPSPQARYGLLALVADGMGGHAAGEVASNMAVHIIAHVYYRGVAEPHQALRKAFCEANRQIYRTARRNPGYQGMGTTCTGLVLRGGAAYCAHVGDSRLYLVRGDAIYLMTEDHSVVMQMLRQGLITQEQARHHADKNIILRALGTRPQVLVSTWGQPLPIKADDRFILCTDGLSDLVPDEEIKAIALAEEPATACEQLIALAKTRGGYDNITVGVLSVKATVNTTRSEDISPQCTTDRPTHTVVEECQQ
jgi:serine/threonine protein phosphatase PrpC